MRAFFKKIVSVLLATFLSFECVAMSDCQRVHAGAEDSGKIFEPHEILSSPKFITVLEELHALATQTHTLQESTQSIHYIDNETGWNHFNLLALGRIQTTFTDPNLSVLNFNIQLKSTLFQLFNEPHTDGFDGAVMSRAAWRYLLSATLDRSRILLNNSTESGDSELAEDILNANLTEWIIIRSISPRRRPANEKTAVPQTLTEPQMLSMVRAAAAWAKARVGSSPDQVDMGINAVALFLVQNIESQPESNAKLSQISTLTNPLYSLLKPYVSNGKMLQILRRLNSVFMSQISAIENSAELYNLSLGIVRKYYTLNTLPLSLRKMALGWAVAVFDHQKNQYLKILAIAKKQRISDERLVIAIEFWGPLFKTVAADLASPDLDLAFAAFSFWAEIKDLANVCDILGPLLQDIDLLGLYSSFLLDLPEDFGGFKSLPNIRDLFSEESQENSQKISSETQFLLFEFSKKHPKNEIVSEWITRQQHQLKAP